MAAKSLHFSIKNGSSGRGARHAQYIAGDGKYADREDVLLVKDANIPEWANSAEQFFSAADSHEQSAGKSYIKTLKNGQQKEVTPRGRSYREIEAAIPRECADPVGYAIQYAERLLGKNHPYRLAVHSKLAEDGELNPHIHLMWSDRKLDGIERPSAEVFFKRAASNYRDRKTGELVKADPSKGGAAKAREWSKAGKAEELRRDYESYAGSWGIEIDLRSNAAKGLTTEPEPKIGPKRVRSRRDKFRDERAEAVKNLRDVRYELAQASLEADYFKADEALAEAQEKIDEAMRTADRLRRKIAEKNLEAEAPVTPPSPAAPALPEGWLEIPKAAPVKRLPPKPEDFVDALSSAAITLDQLPTIDEIPSLDDLILRGFEEEIDEQVELEIEAQPAEEVEEKDELDKVLESLEILDLPPELQEEIANLIRGMNQEERREFAAMLHPDFNLDAERERLEAAERAEREAAQERERQAAAQREAERAERERQVAQERERIAAEQREAAAYREAQEEAERTEQRRQEFIAELLDEQKALKDHERQLRNQLSQIPEPEVFNPNFERYHREQTIKQEINSLARQTGKPPAYEEGGYDPWDRRRFHAQQAGNKAEVKMWSDAIVVRDRMFAEKMAEDTAARKAVHDRRNAEIIERRNPLIEAIEAVLERLAEIVETLGWLGYEPPLQQQQKPLQQQERPPVQQQQKQPRRGRGRG